ncbi:MAG: hypothetical protein PHU43_11325, partial [Candidatus Bipolaricaulis sp.]|nr:hypothetical protein [Candidatus Bipolaricaulis sp.]
LYADFVLLLVDGATHSYGRPSEAITEGSLRAAYGIDFEIVQGQSGARAVVPRMSKAFPG